MNLADILAGAAVGLLLACVVLLAAILRGARRAAAALAEQQSAVVDQVAGLHTRLALLEAELAEVKETTAVMVPPEPPRSGLNLTRRSEALRRLRKGESPSLVAAALSIPIGEAELLGKVQRMLVAAAGDAAERRPRPNMPFTAMRGPVQEQLPGEAAPEQAPAL